MIAFGIAVACWLASAIGALLFRDRPFSATLGAAGAVVGGLAAALSALATLASGAPETWSRPWSLPGGALGLRLDPLAAVFLLPVATVGAVCAVYGVAYLRRHAHGGSPGASFATYNLLLASMAVVVAANDVLLLLIAWELMTLSSWLLVVSDHEKRTVRTAGLQYLFAAHLATAALLLLTILLATGSDTFEIAALSGTASVPSGYLFVLALVGFGTKAGIVPLHVWLPDAHAAAPSHVSALMSAVMVTMGFYGLARFVPLLGTPAPWWGYVLLFLGAASSIGGILFALAQRDVKRVLAYSTVENMGIAAIALGLGLLGTSLEHPGIAAMGWTAMLLHLWNHAAAKSTLFLGFGAIAQGVGSRDLDRMGGFMRRWALIGVPLVLGSSALASLPGLNVFTSEWLLLRGLLRGGTDWSGVAQGTLLGTLTMLGFAGGLAVACFARLVGIALLGTARTVEAARAPQPSWAMRASVLALATPCVFIAIAPAAVASGLGGAVAWVAPAADVDVAVGALRPLALLPILLVAITAALFALKVNARRRGQPDQAETWGCGYASPTPAMQYTSTSFGQPLTQIMQPVLHTEVRSEFNGPSGRAPWSPPARWGTHTPDRILAGFYGPLFRALGRGASRLRAFQGPRVTVSLLYIALTVVALLALLFLPVAGAS